MDEALSHVSSHLEIRHAIFFLNCLIIKTAHFRNVHRRKLTDIP